MDPFSALSLVTNVVQLIDFGTRVVSASFELYSPDGTSANKELETIINDLTKICAGLEQRNDQKDAQIPSKSEQDLIQLSLSCKKLGEELLSILHKLKVSGPHRKWQSFRQALKAVWKEKEIARYKERTTSLRSEIAFYLISILRYVQIMLLKLLLICSLRDEQSKIVIALDKLAENHLRFEILSKNQATQSKRQIMASLDKLTSLATNNSKSSQDESTDVMANLTSQLSALVFEGDDHARKQKVIDSLYFETIFERPRRIVEAYPTTFEWLFADVSPAEHVELSMLQWLKTGSSKYWVSGKAGSGKSTLMKFLVNDRRTREAVRTWAGEKRLIVASYFFWNAGTNMQKSQHGLLQTLLYIVLQQWPPLVSQVCQAQLQKAAFSGPIISWRKAEILNVLNHLRMQTSDSTRLCFFIDGLDEFDGDHRSSLQSWRASHRIISKFAFRVDHGTSFKMLTGPTVASN